MIFALLALPLLWLPAEVCVSSPEPPAAEPPEWHWRTIDDRKCYFRADKLLPREDLYWEYDAQEFNAMEGATVLDQKHYKLEDLRQQVESPDSSRAERTRERKIRHWERKQRRHLRRDRDDDDDD